MSDFVVTAHQPNLFLGASIVTKIQAADAVIWLDEVQFTKNGWTNRNKLPDGRWLTVPVERHCAFQPINRVRIGEPEKGWREPFVRALVDAWPGEVTAAICREILRPYKLLVGLNVAILRILLAQLAPTVLWAFQSHLAGGHSVPAVSSDREALKPISERLAAMVEELGGTVYLSGPSGRNYLDEEPFVQRGLTVTYWHHEGPNPCALALIDQRTRAVA
ncbi:MAG: hypothetical protein KatS3mg015_2553 [Fimbriimonadales bacterium]|nr:MAG: hypothetical protein KatS3mg015_2553 [Fimbriimonadales bacterium]